MKRYLTILAVCIGLIIAVLLTCPAQAQEPQQPQVYLLARPTYTPLRPWLWGKTWTYTPVVVVPQSNLPLVVPAR